MMEQDQFPEELVGHKWELPLPCKDEFLCEDYLRKNSVTYKILNDTFTRVWSSDSEEDNKKAFISKNVATPKAKRKNGRLLKIFRPFTAYPKPSRLTIKQQEVYLHLMKKFSNNFSPFMSKQDQEEFQIYQTLQEKVTGEQLEYLEFLKNFALANQSRYSSIDPDIKKYINELWKVKLKNPLKYPRFYKQFRTVALVLNDTRDPLDLLPQDEILRMGKMKPLDLSREVIKIERTYPAFVSRHPIIDSESANKDNLTTLNCPVSLDQNAEVIARRVNVNFVLSSSSLKKICDNYPPFNKSWELPVRVKELEVEENGLLVKRRVVFIDKALPRQKMTTADKILLYHKIAIKSLLVKYRHRPRRTPGCLYENKIEGNKDSENPSDWCEGNEHDTFGVEGLSSSTSTYGLPQSTRSQESEKCKEATEEISATNESSHLNSLDASEETSSPCISDSDDEQLIINDPETTGKAKSDPKYPNDPESHVKGPTVAADVAESKKPVTRRMAKMLENLKKVEEITGKKRSISSENLSTVKNMKISTLGNMNTAVSGEYHSPNKDISNEKCIEKNFTHGKDSESRSRPLSLLDEVLEQQKKWFDHERSKPDQDHPEQRKLRKRKEILAGYRPVPPPNSGNFVYRLFELTAKGSSVPGYKLLIRCKLDAQEDPPAGRFVTIVPKLEFQPEFGAEAVTISELTQNWLSVRMRPNSFLVRARINAFTSDVMMTEKKEGRDFYRDEKYHNMQVSSCLHTLDAVFRAFYDLPTGQYIFGHDPKMGAFGNLYVATSDKIGGLYDLHKHYDVDTTSEEPHIFSNIWIPIDFSVITPLHDELKRVPGTFIPKKNQQESKYKRKKKKRKPTEGE